MSISPKRIISATLLLVSGLFAQELQVAPDRPTGIYEAGQSVTFNISVKGDNAAAVSDVRYHLKKNGLTVIKEGALPLTDGKASLTATMDAPGSLLLQTEAKAGEKKITRDGGAIFSPEKLQPSSPRPADFDEFWRAKLEELAAVPANPVLEDRESGNPNVKYAAITMNNIRGTHIYGQLARPAAGEKFPALLVVQWAGVYGLDKSWAVDRAKEGWLVLNIMPHDLPFDKPKDFYKEQSDGPLKDYPQIGADSRETSYFLRMYLSCYRGADYLTTRPDWDGKTLVVTGGSQGGLQSIVTGAIFPKTTAIVACVPAGCDNSSLDVGRAPGWPMWPWWGKDEAAKAKIKATAPYFDVIHFATNVKCPALIGIGGIDTVCPSPGVYAAVNQMKGPVEVVFMPAADHMGKHDAYYARSGPWMNDLKQGKLPTSK